MKKTSPEARAKAQEEEEGWSEEVARLQLLLPFEASRNRLQLVDLPTIGRQIKEKEEIIPTMSKDAEEV